MSSKVRSFGRGVKPWRFRHEKDLGVLPCIRPAAPAECRKGGTGGTGGSEVEGGEESKGSKSQTRDAWRCKLGVSANSDPLKLVSATLLAPSPLVGEGRGGGASVSWLLTPTLTLPHQGGGNCITVFAPVLMDAYSLRLLRPDSH